MPTKILFLDEQEGYADGEKYTAVVGFRVNAEDLNVIRAKFYPKFNELFDEAVRGPNREGKTIHRLPHLHGVEFLKDFDDATKFRVLDALVDSLSEVELDFIRIGYFDRSFPEEANIKTRDQILSLCILGCSFAICEDTGTSHFFVSEIDKEALKKNLVSTFQELSQIYVMNPKGASYNVLEFIGHYYAPKAELGCQIADVINYACLKSHSAETDFGQRFGKYYSIFRGQYLANQIIWLNDPDRTFQMKQKNPKHSYRENYRTNPIFRMATVIPNDGPLKTKPFPVVN